MALIEPSSGGSTPTFGSGLMAMMSTGGFEEPPPPMLIGSTSPEMCRINRLDNGLTFGAKLGSPNRAGFFRKKMRGAAFGSRRWRLPLRLSAQRSHAHCKGSYSDVRNVISAQMNPGSASAPTRVRSRGQSRGGATMKAAAFFLATL